MAVTLNGVIHGRHIDLDAEPLVPDGAAVIVRIERKPLTKDEKRRLLAATAGAWATDPSLATVFAEIAQRRRDAVPRETTNLAGFTSFFSIATRQAVGGAAYGHITHNGSLANQRGRYYGAGYDAPQDPV